MKPLPPSRREFLKLAGAVASAHALGPGIGFGEPGRGSRFVILIPIPKTETGPKKAGVEIRGYPVEEGSYHGGLTGNGSGPAA